MQATGNKTKSPTGRLTIRISKNSLSFSVIDRDTEQQVIFEPYIVKSGISMAANLRQALKESMLLEKDYKKVRVFIDAPTLLIPIEEFQENDIDLIFKRTFSTHESDCILYRVQPTLNVVSIFPINKDLKMVVEDHFDDIRFTPVMQPVWNYLHQRSFARVHQKLYAYFHDKKLELFSFEKNRFKFFNSFDAVHAKDALYFMLYVWKQLNLSQRSDEMYFIGDIPDKDWLIYNTRLYLKKTLLLNPVAEFNRAPITSIKNMPFDLLALYLSK